MRPHNPLVPGSNPGGATNLFNDLQPQAFTATFHCGKFVAMALDPDWIASTALRLPSSVACAYLSVIVVVLWPITSRIAFSGTPASAALVPNVCLKS